MAFYVSPASPNQETTTDADIWGGGGGGLKPNQQTTQQQKQTHQPNNQNTHQPETNTQKTTPPPKKKKKNTTKTNRLNKKTPPPRQKTKTKGGKQKNTKVGPAGPELVGLHQGSELRQPQTLHALGPCLALEELRQHPRPFFSGSGRARVVAFFLWGANRRCVFCLATMKVVFFCKTEQTLG